VSFAFVKINTPILIGPGIVAIIGGTAWGISLVNEQEGSEGNSEQ
jgi:hypothetical protein